MLSRPDPTCTHSPERRPHRPRLPPLLIIRPTILLGLASILFQQASGQPGPTPPQYVVSTWTTDQGLPQNTVISILQSRDGYLWVTTFDGAARFDGHRFRIYNKRTVPDFPNNRTTAMLEDGRGVLWIGTDGGVVRLENGNIATFGVKDGLPRDQILALGEDAVGRIWVSTHPVPNGSLGQIEDGRVLTGSLISDDVFGGDPGGVYARDRNGALWIALRRGLIRYHEGSVRTFDERDGLPGSRVLSMHSDFSGNFWVGTRDGIWKRIGSGGFKPFTPLAQDITAYAFHELDERVWVGYSDRFCVYRMMAGGVELERCFESEHPVRVLYADRDGNVWVGLDGGGLLRVRRSLFSVFSTDAGLDYGVTRSVAEGADGTIWVGTNCGGLSHLANGRFTRYTDALMPYNACLNSVYIDREGMLWTGSEFLTSRGQNEAFRIRGGGRPRLVQVVYEEPDSGGVYWIGTTEGVYRLDVRNARGDATIHYSVANGLVNDAVRGILKDRGRRIWISTAGGLSRLEDGRFTNFTPASGFPSADLRALYEDADGVLWIGTYGDGLIRLKGQEAVQISAGDGLFDDVVSSIMEDDAGRLWMSGNRGIFWADRESLNEFANGRAGRVASVGYGREAGLLNPETNGGHQPAGWKARDGRLWFPTLDGVAVVDPKEIDVDQTLPTVHIERIQTVDSSMSVGSEIRLPLDRRRFEIEYTGISLSAAETVRFRYRMKGLHQDWTEAGSRRRADYSHVPPGTYTFQVLAANRDGVWTTRPAELIVHVPSHFYETGWFTLACAMLLSIVLAFLFRGRVRRHRRRALELERQVSIRTDEYLRAKKRAEEAQKTIGHQAHRLRELNESKSQFMANISHELRTPLTLTLGPLEDLKSGRFGPMLPKASQQVALALRNTRRQLRLIEELLDVARLESGTLKLKLERVELCSLLKNLSLAFSSLAEQRQISFEFEAPPRPVWIAGDPNHLEKIFVNLLSNAFKYSPAGGTVYLGIHVADTSEWVEVVVQDNGPGIPSELRSRIFERFFRADHMPLHTGTGIGLSIVKELVELHGGRVDVQSRKGLGALFTVSLREIIGEPEAPEFDVEEGDGEFCSAVIDDIREELTQSFPIQSPDAEVVPAEVGPDDTRASILIVDDDDDFRWYLRSHIESRYTVHEARDGREAMAAALKIVPDVVLMDVLMPDMNGYDLCRSVKRHPDLSFVPVILLTGLSDPDNKVTGYNEGADDYIVKPFHPAELFARIENLIAASVRIKLSEQKVGLASRLHVESPDMASDGDTFIDRVRGIVEAHLNDPDFNVETLANEAAVSRSSLYRRLNELVGESPNDLIVRFRLERAAQLLSSRTGPVSAVAYAVGFKSVAHFSRRFRDQFGMSPTEYAANLAS